jgi:Tubulin like
MTELVNVSPTLIIGLGGTGSFALQYVKRKILGRLEAYKAAGRPIPPHIPFIEYLVLDTTAQEEVLDDLFVPDEYLNIGRLNISRIISHLDQESDYNVQKWFPKELDPGQIDSGAGGVRAIGRLCFFINQSEIEKAIRNKIRTITSYGNIRNFFTEHLPGLWIEEGSTIDVHIVSSLCGGTGSACLLDTSYLVKHIVADDQKQQTNSTAHLVTPEPFEGEPGIGRSSREYIHYNFAVTLSEVEHFTQKDAPRPWEVEYRGGTKVSIKDKPFSVAYLIGCKEGASLDKEEVCEIIGEAIAIKTVHPEGRRIKGIIENFKPHIINTEDSKKKRRTYSSYNARILNLGIDKSLLDSATKVAARSILSSLCEEEILPGMPEQAFKEYEEGVFAEKMRISQINFEAFFKRLNREVPIRPDMFDATMNAAKYALTLPDKKRKAESQYSANTVMANAKGIEEEIIAKQILFLSELNKAFGELRKATDERINLLLQDHSFPFVQMLLENVSDRLREFTDDLAAELETFPDSQHNYGNDVVRAIEMRTGPEIPVICAKKARATIYVEVLNSLSKHMTGFKREVDKHVGWCRAAQQCMADVRKAFIDEKRVIPSSHTTRFVWTQDAVEQLISEAKSHLVRKFIGLLEQKYYKSGEMSRPVCFLLHLNDTLEAKDAVKKLAQQAADEALDAEIKAQAERKRQEALHNMHQFVEMASPPWQIERLGEDIAAVSVTTCPEDSHSGQIMARSGKNINFSRNGNSSNEFMLFRSEHGVSVNHLINFRRCLKAVSRKIQSEGKERLNDLCLDPEWNIAAPLPIEEEMEMLRLYFSLALRFQFLKPEMKAYTFTMPSGREVELRQNSDIRKAVRRYEAFERLLDLDCDGSEDSRYFKHLVEEEISRRKEEARIDSFRIELSAYQESLRQLIPQVKDVRDRNQLEKEIKSIEGFIEEIDTFLKETRHDDHGS